MKRKLSERHLKILKFINEYQQANHHPPSIREIGENVGFASTSVVNYYLDQLEKQGVLERDRRVSRGIRITKDGSSENSYVERPKFSRDDEDEPPLGKYAEFYASTLKIPVIGNLEAEHPTPVLLSKGELGNLPSCEIPRSWFSPDIAVENLFALTVHGKSFQGSHFDEGDLIILTPLVADTPIKKEELTLLWVEDPGETRITRIEIDEMKNGYQFDSPKDSSGSPIDLRNYKLQAKVLVVVRKTDLSGKVSPSPKKSQESDFPLGVTNVSVYIEFLRRSSARKERMSVNELRNSYVPYLAILERLYRLTNRISDYQAQETDFRVEFLSSEINRRRGAFTYGTITIGLYVPDWFHFNVLLKVFDLKLWKSLERKNVLNAKLRAYSPLGELHNSTDPVDSTAHKIARALRPRSTEEQINQISLQIIPILYEILVGKEIKLGLQSIEHVK